jgi:hypothetical protein
MYGLTLNSIPNMLGLGGVVPGRRYPRYQDWQGLDIQGEAIDPSQLPNPYQWPRIDPLDRPYIRPAIPQAIPQGPSWNM